MSLELFGKFESEIHKNKFQPSNHVSTFKAVTPNKPKPTPQVNSHEKKSQDMFGSQSDGYGSGYESQPGTPGTPGGSQGGQYEARTNSGQPVPGASLNISLGDRGDFVASDAKPLGNCCRVTTSTDDFLNVNDRFRFMYTPVDERARAIDRQLLHIQSDMCEAHFISELQPVGIPSPELVWVCGRICNEATEGKINRQSIILEGSLKESGGRRIRLDVSELTEFSIFPGQIICVQGINPSGAVMTARRIIEGKALPLPRTDPKALLEMHYSPKFQGGRPLKVRIAVGPYTTSDNLDFAPLQDLLSNVLADKPDVVVMLGPFVDAHHPMLKTGAEVLTDSRYDDDDETTLQKNKKVKTDLHAGTYETLFRERIGKDGFTRFFNSEEDDEVIATQFVLVPSVGDVFHEFVFPQPPFGDREAISSSFFADPFGKLDIPYSKDKDGGLKRVHLVSNPCMFRINEILFGTCTNDVLFSLSSDETSKISENRLARLSSHVLSQQSFHPQFPTPPSMNNQAVPVSSNLMREYSLFYALFSLLLFLYICADSFVSVNTLCL